MPLKHVEGNHKIEKGIRYLVTEQCPLNKKGEILTVKYIRAFKNLDAVTGYIGLRRVFGKRNIKTTFYVARALQTGHSKYIILEILPQTYKMG